MMPKAAMMANARPDMMWHGAPNTPQSHGAVSVVTTVYPGMPAFAGPPQTYNTSTTHPNGNSMFGNASHGPPPSSSYVGQPGPVTKTPSSSSTYGPMDGGLYGSPHDVQHHQGYPSHGQVNDFASSAPRHAVAINAAAQATAAAVATATATATAVAIDQSQFQSYQQPLQYGNQSYQPQMGMMAPNHHQPDPYAANPGMMTQQRHPLPSPYVPVQSGLRPTRAPAPNMARYSSNVVSRGPSSMGPVESFNQHQYGVSGTPAPGMGPPNMAILSQRPMAMQQQQQQQQHAVGMYGSPNVNNASNMYQQQQRFASNDIRGQQYQGPMAVSNSGPVNAGYGQMAGPAPMQNNYGHQVNGAALNYQNRGNNAAYGGPIAALPNNPTPPLTPAATGGAPQGPAGFGLNAGVPPTASQGDDTEPRLTLPVKNGTILAPFRLEHNSPVSQHMFTLDERTYQMLMSNINFDLQLKCFHADDKAMANNWPHNANIQICVNGSPVIVKSVERPLYIKMLCQKQQNTLQVAVQQCCCSHLFCLSVVSRPSIESVVREVTRTRTLPTDQCVEKIRGFFNSGEAAQVRGSSGECNPDIEQMSVTMSLKCPITMKRIKIPARGKECKHPQCFDLAAYFEINKDRSNWQCPICKRPAAMESLEIDQYVLQILSKLSNFDAEEVTVDSTAMWKPVMKQPTPQSGENSAGPSVKEEEADVPCGSAKRFKPDPGYSPAPWNQPSSVPPPSTTHFQSPVYNRSESVLSPFYQANNSPSAAASFPSSVGTPGSAGPAFGSPTTQRQTAPKPSKPGAMPMTPQQMTNPPSASMPSNMVEANSQMQPSSVGFGGGCATQQTQNPVFSGSSYPTSAAESGAAGGYQNNGAGSSNTGLSDFPDFTFDDSDLLGSGDMAQTSGGLLNDPEEWMKYLTDPSDFGPFGMPPNDQQRHPNYQDQTSTSSAKYSTSSNVANAASANNTYRNSSYSSSELASMDDILALLRKN